MNIGNQVQMKERKREREKKLQYMYQWQKLKEASRHALSRTQITDPYEGLFHMKTSGVTIPGALGFLIISGLPL